MTLEVRQAEPRLTLQSLVQRYGLEAILVHLADVAHVEATRSVHQQQPTRALRFQRAEDHLRRAGAKR